ncbi:MAG: 5-formyltetrahydrofolate cyclo-ligase [Cyanobacteria bacterium J06592_8]
MIPKIDQTSINFVNNQPTPPTKNQLRLELLEIRQSMLAEDWRTKSDRLCSHLLASALFEQAETVLAYVSFRQEPDLSRLFAETSKMGTKTWGFPRCVKSNLIWHQWKPGELLQTGAYGIWEPDANLPMISASDVDLILVPAVACDQRGYRLGYGGGYYDRMFNAAEWQMIPKIGIVFEFAYLPQLPIDEWDQPLNAVCTEEGLRLKP